MSATTLAVLATGLTAALLIARTESRARRRQGREDAEVSAQRGDGLEGAGRLHPGHGVDRPAPGGARLLDSGQRDEHHAGRVAYTVHSFDI